MRILGNPVILIFVSAWVYFIVGSLRPQSFLMSDTAFVFILIISQSFLFVIFSKGILNQTYWVFSLLFFGVTPIIEIESNVRSYVGMPPLSDFDFIIAGFYIFIFNFIYAVSYFYYVFKKPIFFPNRNINSQVLCEKKRRRESVFFLYALLISLICFFIVWEDVGGSILALIFRGGEFSQFANEWGPIKLIVQRLIRPIPIIFFLMFVLVYGLRSKFKLILLFTICILVAFPTSLPRFVAAALYIPLLFVFFPSLSKGFNYFYFLIFSILFLFPTLNSFRRYNEFRDIGFVKMADLSFFTAGHFDSFQTFAQVVANSIISYGEQFVLVFLFWVPRTYWEGKPLSTGIVIAEESGAFFTNISANIYAEGWINFGFLGAVFFAVIIGWFNGRLDKVFGFWISNFKLNNLSLEIRMFILLYFILSPMLFITLRGDLVTGVSNTAGMVGAWFLVYRVVRFLGLKTK